MKRNSGLGFESEVIWFMSDLQMKICLKQHVCVC